MNSLEFKLETEYIELAQLLKVTGLAPTGGHAKMMVKNGEVFVDGTVETRRGRKIRPGQTIKFGQEVVRIIG